MVLAGSVLLSGCVPASPDVGTYDDRADQTLQSGVSETRSVETVLEGLHDGRMLRPTAKTQLRYSESSLGTADTAFTELNPPPSRDWLDQATSNLMNEASDLVTEARVTVERNQPAQYAGLARDLEKVASKMEKLEGRVP